MKDQTIVLDSERIARIIKRIAYQVIETFGNQGELIILGIPPRGIWVADQVFEHLKKMSTLQIQLEEYSGKNILGNSFWTNKQVLLVDDIVNSGTTMMKAAGELALAEANTVRTACLVDRLHRKFPIQSDFTGLSLATTIQEHLSLNISPSPNITLH